MSTSPPPKATAPPQGSTPPPPPESIPPPPEPTPAPLESAPPPPHPEEPTASCNFWGKAILWKVEIGKVSHWRTEEEDTWPEVFHGKLNDKCGQITKWKVHKNDAGERVKISFQIPLLPVCAGGELQGLIKNAGGPEKVRCHKHR